VKLEMAFLISVSLGSGQQPDQNSGSNCSGVARVWAARGGPWVWRPRST